MTAVRKIDPLEPGAPPLDKDAWPADRRRAYDSEAMEASREGLRRPGIADVRSAVLADLCEYLDIDEDLARHRALHSRELDAEQWGSLPDQPTSAELTEFYQRNHSWVPGLLWYSYLQAEGYAWPVAAMIAEDLRDADGGAVLDFGSGVGAAGLMFHRLGWSVTFADISTPLLDFVRFRCRVRGVEAEVLDLKTKTLPGDRYHAVAAIQTMAHLPDVGEAARRIHRSIRSGGRLYADFDVNERSGVDSRLYDDDLPLRRATCDAGFVEGRRFDWGTSIRYERRDVGPVERRIRRVEHMVRFGPPRRVLRLLRGR